jgi:hypothetical protein
MKKRQRGLESIIKKTDDFSETFKVSNYDSRYLFSIDENRRKIIYLVANDARYCFQFENVISVEILEDSTSVYSKSSLRTIGGGVVGGIIAGGAGAIVGGLSGSYNGKKKVSEITVKILLRNYSTPAIYIYCFQSTVGQVSADSLMCKLATEEARKIADKLSVVIDMIDREEKAKQQDLLECSLSTKASIADELEKLSSLKEKGIISQEEFERFKDKLLKQ